MLALIDGDIAAYRAAAATQRVLSWGDGLAAQTYANSSEGVRAALQTVRLWTEAVEADKCLVALTGDANFRKTVYPLYKANRVGVKPLSLQVVKQAIFDNFPTIIVEGLEADDLLGMALTTPSLVGKAVCVTLDKDLRTVPGLHFNPSKDKRPLMVTEGAANVWWFTQALTGDTVDGYPGAKGIGPKKAARILDGWDGEDLEEGFKRLKGFFHTDDAHSDIMAHQMLNCARILRHGDYDKRKKVVTLWATKGPGEVINLNELKGS